MQKLFSHRFSQNIWRILPDSNPQSDLWAIELRNTEEKKISLAVLDTKSESLLWAAEPEGTDWWSSLTAFSGGNIYMHNYRNPEVPEPTDLLAYSVQDGQLKWALSNYTLITFAGRETLKVVKAGQLEERFCSALTGELISTDSTEQEEADEIILAEPFRYKGGNVYFEKMAAFVQKMTDGHNAVSIDYLEKRPFMIFSYYIYEQEKTVQYLLIVTDTKELVLHERLSEEREGIGRSTMILKASTLVYLKNNNEFSSLTLS